MKINNRLGKISVYHFKHIDEMKNKRKSEGKKLIDLSIGDPDLPVDSSILDTLIHSLHKEGFNKYPPYDGSLELKKEVINYYKKRFKVELSLEEVVILIGSKEGISNIIPAICDLDDIVIVPEPAYPVYRTCATMWGCLPYTVPLKEKNNYIMDMKDIPKDIVDKAKLLFINYPNNPTGAKATGEFFLDIVKFCKEHNIVLCNDAAYNEIIEPEEEPISILQFDDDKYSLEFGTFSKLYNMTGFRIGYAVGNKEIIEALIKVKSNLDSGQFTPIQSCACKAIQLEDQYREKVRSIYKERRKVAERILEEKNIRYFHTDSTFYIWCKTPKGYTTAEFCSEILEKYGVVVTPGACFGILGNDYFRIALTCSTDIISEGLLALPLYN